MKMNKKQLLNYMTKVSIFSALSTILYFFPKFPLPFLFPSFLDIQFSNLPAIIGGFGLGPIGGIIIVVIRTLIKLPFSSTFMVGELADLIIGSSAVLASSLIYHFVKTKKGAIISLIVGTLVWVMVAIFANWLILIPFYVELAGIEGVIGMCSNAIPSMNADNMILKYILYATIPFNLLLATMTSLVTFFVYKRISVFLKKEFFH